MPVEDKIDKIFDKLDNMAKCQSNIEKSIVKIEIQHLDITKTVDVHDKLLNGDPAKQGEGGVIYALTMIKKDVALITAGVSVVIAATITFVLNVFKHKTGG